MARTAPEQTAQERLDAYVARVLDEAPPLTPAQSSRIAAMLRPLGSAPYRGEPSPAELERRRKAAEEAERLAAAEALAKKASEAAIACAVCGIPPVAHYAQRAYGDFHDWVPRNAQEIQAALAALFEEKQA